MKSFLFGCCFCLGLSACQADHDPAPAATGVSIRVRNASPYFLTTIRVSMPGGDHRYPPLNPGQRSVYHSFAQAYRYAYIETYVNGKALVLRPIDYMGERQLEPGSYTYVLDVTTDNGTKRLTLQLEKP